MASRSPTSYRMTCSRRSERRFGTCRRSSGSCRRSMSRGGTDAAPQMMNSSVTTESSTDVSVPAVLLDTSVVIDLEVIDRGEYAESAAVVSAVTVGELAYGLGSPDVVAREARLRRVLTGYEVLAF